MEPPPTPRPRLASLGLAPLGAVLLASATAVAQPAPWTKPSSTPSPAGGGFASASTSLTPSVAPGDCPGDAMIFYDLSGGLGAELRLGRQASLLATARLVRRARAAGELTFATESVNPPLTARDEALGASFGLALVGYFSR